MKTLVRLIAIIVPYAACGYCLYSGIVKTTVIEPNWLLLIILSAFGFFLSTLSAIFIIEEWK